MKPAISREDKHPVRDAATPARNSKLSSLMIAGAAVVLAAVALLALFVAGTARRPHNGASGQAVTNPPAEPALVEFEKLKGKWLRPDGGYVLELKRLLDQNGLEAAYFNPNPIHVGKARLTKERGFVKVFVELQDVNYPGSTYTLIYDQGNDQLRGIYYQATQQQEYEVSFTRLPGS